MGNKLLKKIDGLFGQQEKIEQNNNFIVLQLTCAMFEDSIAFFLNVHSG